MTIIGRRAAWIIAVTIVLWILFVALMFWGASAVRLRPVRETRRGPFVVQHSSAVVAWSPLATR